MWNNYVNQASWTVVSINDYCFSVDRCRYSRHVETISLISNNVVTCFRATSSSQSRTKQSRLIRWWGGIRRSESSLWHLCVQIRWQFRISSRWVGPGNICSNNLSIKLSFIFYLSIWWLKKLCCGMWVGLPLVSLPSFPFWAAIKSRLSSSLCAFSNMTCRPQVLGTALRLGLSL